MRINFNEEHIGDLALGSLIKITKDEEETDEEERTQEEKDNIIKLIDEEKNRRKGYYKRNPKDKKIIQNFIKI